MEIRLWKIVAIPLIIGGAANIIYSVIMMDTFRDLVSAIIVMLLGLLIMMFRRENLYLAFFIAGFFFALKVIFEVIMTCPVIELYEWIDLVGFWMMIIIGTLLFRRKNG
ncbi:MAG: hypothetical protein IBX40_07810 [Methanosarcinales archaeon]|nr:hypothetical protein [Methanosarcinales archaeon]